MTNYLYGVTITRERNDGQALECVVVRANSPDGAIAKTLLRKRLVNSIDTECLGVDGDETTIDKQTHFLMSAKADYDALGISKGLLGELIT